MILMKITVILNLSKKCAPSGRKGQRTTSTDSRGSRESDVVVLCVIMIQRRARR